jgi:pyruvyltransferase
VTLRQQVRAAVPRGLLWRVSPIRLSWATGEDPKGNFGDQLSPHLVRRLFGARVQHSGMPTADLLSTGSLLDWAEESVGGRKPYVWGSGFIRPGPRYGGRVLRPLAVRGNLTAQRLEHLSGRKPLALGDPGILTVFAFPEFKGARRHRVGVVPHFTDLETATIRRLEGSRDVEIIDVRAPVREVIRQICSCRLVISSSLHGLVVAESYGVPNFWLAPGPRVDGGRYKFDDYFSAFGVSREPASLDELLADLPERTAAWRPLPGLTSLQQGLLEAFLLPARHGPHRSGELVSPPPGASGA